jgi:hypothetical protein
MPASGSHRTFSAVEMTPGKTYRVIAEFQDYDGRTHSIGETWTYTRHDFLPYEDGLTLYTLREGTTSVIRLQWRDETQGHLVDNFSEFVEEIQSH